MGRRGRRPLQMLPQAVRNGGSKPPPYGSPVLRVVLSIFAGDQRSPLRVCFFTVCISVWYLLIRLARFLQAKMYRFAGAQSTFPIKGRQGLDCSLRLRTDGRVNLKPSPVGEGVSHGALVRYTTARGCRG